MTAIQHFAMNCIDRHRQEAFYTKHFGFQRARVFNRGTENEFVMLRLGGFCIEMFDNPGAGEARGGEQAVGFKHLAFLVEDIEAKVAELEADGVATDGIVDCGGICPGMRVCFFKDPDGNILEVMEGYQDE